MGIGSNWAVEIAEENHREAKIEWIRNELGDSEADENTEGWDDVSEKFDQIMAEQYYEENLYDEDYWGVEGKSKLQIFNEILDSSTELLSLPVSTHVSKNILVMLHGHIVAAVEAYLSSTFIDSVISSDDLLRKLVESDPVFAERKFSMKEIFIKKEQLKEDVKKYLKNIIFHDIEKIKPMYKDVLGIDFGDVGWLFKAVLLRHHCAHRAGYDKDGNEVDLDQEKIKSLMANCSDLVHRIELESSNVKFEDGFFS